VVTSLCSAQPKPIGSKGMNYFSEFLSIIRVMGIYVFIHLFWLPFVSCGLNFCCCFGPFVCHVESADGEGSFVSIFVFYVFRTRSRTPELRAAGVVPRLNPTPLDSSFYLLAAVVLPLTSTPIPSTAASVGCVQDVTDGRSGLLRPTGARIWRLVLISPRRDLVSPFYLGSCDGASIPFCISLPACRVN